ncbi:MAG: choice-of-anchor domain, partial [Bryobacterales bacterium]|nr:choice-of-anchor domain [Bryobacterales bacterium]
MPNVTIFFRSQPRLDYTTRHSSEVAQSFLGFPVLNLLPSRLFRVLPFLCLCSFAFTSPSFAAGPKASAIALPIVFEENRGQAPKDALFLSRSGGAETLYGQSGIDIRPPGKKGDDTQIRMEWWKARTPTVKAEEPLAGRSNYLIGSDAAQWTRGIRQYGQVRYGAMYPGIDLVFHGNGDAVEHDFVVQPGARASLIGFRLSRAARILKDGSLEVPVPTGSALHFARPVAYQDIDGRRETVEASFQMHASGAVTFRVGAYDHSRVLVIDPVLTFSTYLAGTTQDSIAAVTTDASGNIYVTGTTGAADFPVKNPLQATNKGGDAFVSKLDPTGHTLLYSTYLGGTQGARGGGIAIDQQGNIVVSGTAAGPDFPLAGAIKPLTCQTNYFCYFLASIKPDGATLNYSGQIGGTDYGAETGKNGHLALDKSGNAYLTGNSWDPNFQLTAGTYSGTTEPAYPDQQLFVMKVDPTGNIVYSTMIPGNSPYNPASSYNNFFQSEAIAVDANGQVTVAGTAGQGLPTTAGVLASTFP